MSDQPAGNLSDTRSLRASLPGYDRDTLRSTSDDDAVATPLEYDGIFDADTVPGVDAQLLRSALIQGEK